MGQLRMPATVLRAYNADQAIRGAVVRGGTRLNAGDFVRSPVGVTDKTVDQTRDASGPLGERYELLMQDDGNLVLYDRGGATYDRHKALWASNTAGNRGAYAVMQTDGNLVVYRGDGRPLWASNTAGHPGAVLMVQSDDNLVIYAGVGAGVLWARRDHGTGGFWSGVLDVVKAIPAIAVAPIYVPTLALVDSGVSIAQGKAPTLGTTGDVVHWSATHPVETIAITAGAAAAAAGGAAAIGAFGVAGVAGGAATAAGAASKAANIAAAVDKATGGSSAPPPPAPPPTPVVKAERWESFGEWLHRVTGT